jgi:hypothetical protein
MLVSGGELLAITVSADYASGCTFLHLMCIRIAIFCMWYRAAGRLREKHHMHSEGISHGWADVASHVLLFCLARDVHHGIQMLPLHSPVTT